jgi:membrane protein implicated in regulation of membrane protease activity
VRAVAWWIWLIIAFGIGIIEVTTFTFVLLWIAIAALITAILTPVVPSIWVQLLLFVVVSTALLFATRPLARKWRQTRTYPSRYETMQGKVGVVVTEAQPGAFGTARVEGELWSTKCDHPLRVGQQVVVTSSTATVLTIEPIEERD